MKFKFLGTAAATSMPLAFCNCDVCTRARKNRGRDIRKRASAVINDEMLIDLGPDLCSMADMYHVNLGNIKYLLQTHSHSDHFDAGHFVTRWSEYAVKDLTHLDIFCSKGTCVDMGRWVRQNEPGIDIFNEYWQKDMDYTLHLLKAGDTAEFNGYRVTAIDSKHDENIESLVYIIQYGGKSVFYGTDLKELTENAWEIIRRHSLDLVILDQTYGECFNNGGHLDAGQVREIVKEMRRLGVTGADTRIYATHISHEGNDIHSRMEESARENGYSIAYDGLEINL